MNTSRSDHTTGSNRCCNRTTCPFYMCSKNPSETVYESAQDETSTRFLYFGQNFGGQASGEIQEFRDCRSETDVMLDGPTYAHQMQPKTNSSTGLDSNNYCVVLKQIICMSQKLLAQIERREQAHSMGASCNAGSRHTPGLKASNLQQQQQPMGPQNWGNAQKYNLTGVVQSPGVANIPIGLRMLQIEPVHLTIPFTIHFQGMGPTGPGASPSGTSAHMGPMHVSSITAPIANVTTMPSTSAVDQFPYTFGTQTDLYVSEGKFPPVKIKLEPVDPANTLDQSCDLVDELCAIPLKGASNMLESEKTADIAIQTESKHYSKWQKAQEMANLYAEEQALGAKEHTPGIQDGQHEKNITGFSDHHTQTDSYRDNSYIELPSTVTQDATVAESSVQQVPNESLDDKTSVVEHPQHVTFPTTGEEDTTVRTEQLLYEELEQRRQEELQEKQLQQLLEEQELYEKPPPPLDLSENNTISSKLPNNMNYPSQFGRSDSYPAMTSTASSSYQQACTCAKKAHQQSDMDESHTNLPVCCRCHCKLKKRQSRLKVCRSQMSRELVCKSSRKQPASTRLGDDDYFSPYSDSEADKKRPAKKCSKLRVPKEAAGESRPVDAAIMQVLQRMLEVLDCMQERQKRGDTRSVSIRTRQSSQLGELEEGVDMLPTENTDMGSKTDGKIFTCIENEVCSEESFAGEKFIDEPCDCDDDEKQDRATDKIPCCIPYMMITFDPETGLPCCCLHSGAFNSPCQEIPVLNSQQKSGPCIDSRKRPLNARNERSICQSEECEDEAIYGNILIQDEMQIINETQIRVVTTEDVCEEDFIPVEVKVDSRLSERSMMIKYCAETQTEECLGPFPALAPRTSGDLLDELRAFRDELYESESCQNPESKMKLPTSKSRSGGDIRSECDCCHCRAKQGGIQPVSDSVDSCRRELKALVDSVIVDLESMEVVRRQNMSRQQFIDSPTGAPKHAIKSFPVTITEVTELGKSSLYVKWAIHDCFGIGGYEIYVDGYLTNRYFNPRHEAAVVCEIDVRQPHKIALLAKPKAAPGKAIMGAGDIYVEEEPTPTPVHWVPSIYLYEPNLAMDYCKVF